jgi:hypothetical protein
MKCPHCGDPNPGPGQFCMKCGRRLFELSTDEDRPSPAESPDLQELGDDPFALFRSEASARAEIPGGEPVDALEEAGQQAEIDQIGNVHTIPFSVWGPFAGRGARGRHAAWLLNNRGVQADELRDAIIERFEARNIPGAEVERKPLERRGVWVDSRPFFLVRRGLTTVGLYLARFGQDLYISQVTYSKSPISAGRVLVLILMILFIPIYIVPYNKVAADVGNALKANVDNLLPRVGHMLGLGQTVVQWPDLRLFAGLTCCVGPLFLLDCLALAFLMLFSLYKWLTEKDILAALREPPNEFDIDDTTSLDKAVEQTVREALDSIGLMMPSPVELPPKPLF